MSNQTLRAVYIRDTDGAESHQQGDSVMNVQKPQLEKVLNLQFDRDNPRLAGMCVSDQTTDEEIIQILWGPRWTSLN